MTEAAFKNKKNTQAASDNCISTHPSYTEYSWETLINNNRPKNTAHMQNTNQINRVGPGGSSRTVNSTAAARRPISSGSGTRSGYGQSGAAVGARARTSTKSASKTRANASAAVKEQVKKADKIRKKSIVAIHTIVVEKKYSFPLSIVLIALCFTVLIMAIVTTSVQISEITSENSALELKYNSMVSEENELRLLLETRDDLRVVETMAKEDLGMVKKDQVERYYLTVHKEDKIEIVEETEETRTSFFDGIMSLGGEFVERIRGFFGM
ncbi:MAG: hypothetical protein IJ428_06560 [Clostridia bacterium]|nr:hypothetical protein [Clostridia bacterium]